MSLMEHLTSSPLFSVVPVALSVGSVLCVVDHYLSFSTLSFDLFIVSVLITFWYLQTFHSGLNKLLFNHLEWFLCKLDYSKEVNFSGTNECTCFYVNINVDIKYSANDMPLEQDQVCSELKMLGRQTTQKSLGSEKQNELKQNIQVKSAKVTHARGMRHLALKIVAIFRNCKFHW